jgi:hypothetical protein
MTTETERDEESLRLARKAVIARQLTDPLGRLGFRRTRARVEREAGARRLLFVAALATFTGAFGVFAVTADEPESLALPGAATTVDQSPSRTELRPERSETVRRTAVPTPHVRTRSS